MTALHQWLGGIDELSPSAGKVDVAGRKKLSGDTPCRYTNTSPHFAAALFFGAASYAERCFS
jgi:hypothetical protein